ncbi:MAG: polysaccharide deacetylase family protein, partial [Actinomycetia bacterium]|nr:polysaccharide deacetylase family protein [Actinomycetes bacterium]
MLTVDVEEWFHVCGVKGLEGPEQWAELPSRVDVDLDRLLQLLDDFGARATFFILGWLAETRPRLVARIIDAGHEIGCHGYGHQPVHLLGPEAFAVDLDRSLGLLREASGQAVDLYRAPMWSLGFGSTPWAFEIMHRRGILIDSSLTRAPLIGHREHPRKTSRLALEGDVQLLECPPLTGRLFG